MIPPKSLTVMEYFILIFIVMFVTANSTTYELDRGNAIRWGIVDLTSTNTTGFSVRCLQD